jgi:hypothetical protein
MPIESYLVSFSINKQYSNIIITMDKYNIYSKKKPRTPRNTRFRKKGDARVPENYIRGYYKEYKTFRVLLLRRSTRQNIS